MPLTKLKIDTDLTAETILPIEFQGREVALEARAYQSEDRAFEALALVNRATDENSHNVALVRVHSGCVTGDIFHSLRCDCHAQLRAALDRITTTPNGVLIYLPFHEGRGIGLLQKIKAYALQDQGLDTVDANLQLGHPIDARDYNLAAEILKDLGFETIRLMTNNPDKIEALKTSGIAVIEQVPLVVPAGAHNERYLDTKRARMAHNI
ncbi:MAG: GTP cyclohydrolase II [Alphaproteobacteria bacterium]|nr:GTP cyclohydrolase II [Alphaproteobacteria bacterium]